MEGFIFRTHGLRREKQTPTRRGERADKEMQQDLLPITALSLYALLLFCAVLSVPCCNCCDAKSFYIFKSLFPPFDSSSLQPILLSNQRFSPFSSQSTNQFPPFPPFPPFSFSFPLSPPSQPPPMLLINPPSNHHTPTCPSFPSWPPPPTPSTTSAPPLLPPSVPTSPISSARAPSLRG